MGKPKVLILDDEPAVLHAVQRVLRGENLDLCMLASPLEALARLVDGSWAALISDYRMPEMDGIALMEQTREKAPDTVRIMLSGVADIDTVIAAVNRGAVYRVIQKPWNDDELRIATRQAVALYQLVHDNQRMAEIERQAERNRVMLESLGAVCHHFGQPATALQGSLWLLQKELAAADPSARELVDQCVKSSARLAELLHRLNEINEYRVTDYLPGRHDAPGNRILDIE